MKIEITDREIFNALRFMSILFVATMLMMVFLGLNVVSKSLVTKGNPMVIEDVIYKCDVAKLATAEGKE